MKLWYDRPVNDLRWNDLCTKEVTDQCALCDALAERDRFERPFWAVAASCTKMTRWLHTLAPLAWTRVTRFADGVFFDEDAFTFKGVMTFALQMLGSVLGICIAAQFFAHPADVRPRNSEPVGCLDINQYEESFALMGVEYPKKLREIIDRFVNKTEDEKVYGPMHHSMCWYVTPRSAQREQEVGELISNMFRTAPHVSSGGVMAQVEHARRLALGTDSSLQLDREREFYPCAALSRIPSLSSDAVYLDAKVVMKPSNPRSIYTDHSRWEGRIICKNITGIQELVEAIDQSGLQDLERAWAFENIYGARWFINFVELQNRSSHATASKATLSIHHSWRGVAEFLGGTLDITQRGQHFSARVERLLPGEQLWGLIRTKTPIEDSALQVISDPTLVFDREYLKVFLQRYGFLLIPVVFLWWLGNWHRRRVQSGSE
jgi:hypothetical protein